ncbi:MAG: hypothetical protein GX366_00095 [Epulopiscium sp.]|nr:hypothetical protein [Candidatus Epulonipiscium sp.]
MRKRITLLLFIMCLMLPKTIFANTAVRNASPIRFNQNEYVRITQPIRDRMIVFDKQLNVTGEARYNVKITMQLYNKKENAKAFPAKPYRTYYLDPVGFSQTFNELIELREGDNRIRIIYQYTNPQGQRASAQTVIHVTRKSAAEKHALKNLRIDNTGIFTGQSKK